MKTYETVLHKINNGATVSRMEVYDAMKSLVEFKDVSHVQLQMGMILFGLSVRGPSPHEILGLCDFVRDMEPGLLQRRLNPEVDRPVIGLSGSGKKGIKTFNISTPSALVAATAGAFVAKPVSRATSSTTGSSDLLTIAGADLNVSHERMLAILKQTGFGAFSIENTIPTFDSIYGGKFYAPHALSYILAAIVNPVKCDIMMHGLTGDKVDVAAQVLKELGIPKGNVMASSYDGSLFVDEITPLPINLMAVWDESSNAQKTKLNITETFGCPVHNPDDLAPGYNSQYQLRIFLECLRGKATQAQTDTVALNAAIIIANSDIEPDARKAFQLSKEIILSGVAESKLSQFCEATKLAPAVALINIYNTPSMGP